jgi:hypothetical protein
VASQNKQSHSRKDGLKSVQLKNFKSIRNSGIQFAPLTVILGENSGGKSSAIQSIILLAQNLQRDQGANFLLNGSAVKLGTHSEVRNRNSRGPIQVAVELALPDKLGQPKSQESLKVIFTFAASRGASGVLEANKTEIRMVAQELHETVTLDRIDFADEEPLDAVFYWKVSFQSDNSPKFLEELEGQEPTYGFALPEQGFSFIPKSFSREEFVFKWLFRRLVRRRRARASNLSEFEIEAALDAIARDERLGKVERKYYRDKSKLSVANDLLVEYLEIFKRHAGRNPKNSISEDLKTAASLSRLWARIEFEFSAKAGRQLLEEGHLLLALSSLLKNDDYKFALLRRHLPYSDSITESLLRQMQPLSEYLKMSIHYLGPLRVEPAESQRYDVTPNTLLPLGARGELMGYQLMYGAIAGSKSKYPLPPESPKGGRVTIETAVSEWLKYLGLGSNLEIDELGHTGLKAQIDGEGLYQKGTGLSQILPVLTLCLLARTGSTVILEQPELHLHPAAQQKLGDFFLVMVRSGRRLIVETHSEYLVTRLRRLVVVEGMESTDIAIIFTEKSKTGAAVTTYSNSVIDAFGAIDKWPDGFFDFASDDKLAIMMANFESAPESMEEGAVED